MDDTETQVLEDPESWDYERTEKRPGVKGARAVVSVAFTSEDLQQVGEAAQRLGQRTSQFIRDAALEKAFGQKKLATLSSFSGSLGTAIFTSSHMPTTLVSGVPGPNPFPDGSLASA